MVDFVGVSDGICHRSTHFIVVQCPALVNFIDVPNKYTVSAVDRCEVPNIVDKQRSVHPAVMDKEM